MEDETLLKMLPAMDDIAKNALFSGVVALRR